MKLQTFSNEISIPQNSFVPMGEKMIPTAQVKRKFFIPEYSRFKAGVWWEDTGRCSIFPGYDVTKNMTEQAAYNDLMKRVLKGKNPNVYSSIVLYMSTTDQIRCLVQDRNHNFEISCYIAGNPARTEHIPIFDSKGKVDIQQTIAKYL